MSDMISRQDVLDALRNLAFEHTFQFGEYYGEDERQLTIINAGKAIDAIDAIPSAELKRNKGKWQRRKGSDCWECSQCHAVLENDDLGMHNFYFCYHCGANMMNKSGYMDIEEVHYG